MFSWIHLSEGSGAPSVEAKRKIRSHVTRKLALQRTRNHERAREFPAPTCRYVARVDAIYPASDPSIGAPDGESAWRRHQRKRRTASKVAKSNVKHEKDTAGPFASQDTDLIDENSSRPSKRTTADTNTEHLPATLARDSHGQFKRLEAGASQSHSKGILVRNPGPEPLLSMWAIEMPVPGDVMLRICALQMHRFRPEVSMEQASEITGSVWGQSPCQILAYALCLASLGHLHSNSSGHAPGVVPLFKGKVFREIIRRLPVMDAPLSDEMVPSILCLASFEVR